MKSKFYPITKTLLFSIFLLTVFLFCIFPERSAAQNVIRGERPPINLMAVPDNAIEKGIIQIKFSRQAEPLIDALALTKGADGTVKFGISTVDNLNEQFHVTEVKKPFAAALQNTQFTARHRAWGFHLWFTLEVPAGTNIKTMVQQYAQLPEIEVAEPVYRKELIGNVSNAVNTGSGPVLTYTPADPRFNEQWHYHNTGQQGGTPDADIDLPEAWDITKGNSSVIVAVIDDGIQYNHPDLAANMWSGTGYNFVDSSFTIHPGNHGTHVAGTIAANTNNGTGVSGIAGGSGTGDGVRLMSCQVFDGDYQGGFGVAPVWAADQGAAISQNSYGYTQAGVYNQSELDAIDYFNANGGGSVLGGGITIFSAGNNNSSGLKYPGCYSGAFAVAATKNNDMKAWYSNFDTWVDIAAPGGETDYITAQGVLSTLTGNSYGFYQGTSMACPHVSGVAALIISLAPGQLSADDVRNILSSTADDIYPLNPGYEGMLGSGRLNAYQALLETMNYVDPTIIQTPLAFTAQAVSASQIDLNWTKNADNDDVLVARNTDYIFGSPTNGSYSPGDPIPGGGTVIYTGSLGSFSDIGLNQNTIYYYAIWSKNGNSYSLFKRYAQATTMCETVSLPYSETFDDNFMPDCWSQTTTADGQWGIIQSNYAGGTPNEASVSWTEIEITGVTRLISPAMNTAGASSLNLSFLQYYEDYNFGVTCKIQSSSDGFNWDDEAVINISGYGNAIGPINIPITHNIGGTTYVAWVVDGNHYMFNYWIIDNISITGDFSGAETLNVSVMLESLYEGNNLMSKAQGDSGDQFSGDVADKITIELHDANNYNTMYTFPNIDLHTDGTASVSLPAGLTDAYYITIKHRNSIETTSATAVSFSGSIINWDFDAPGKAYGSNLKPAGDGNFLIFGGDITQDGFVDTIDMTFVDNEVSSFSSGYLSTDCNGDGIVDTADMSIIENNSLNFVQKYVPSTGSAK